MIRNRTRTRGDRDCDSDGNRDRNRQRRQRTVSISLADRGQTTQDFAVGIGVFILAVAFVFSFLPTMLTPFDSSVSGGQTAQADRIADRVVYHLDDDYDKPNTIDGDEFADYADDTNDLSDHIGIRDTGDRVSVRLEHLNGSTMENQDEWNAIDTYDNQSAASSARLVTIEETNEPDCTPTCRLVVRVW